jgi:hypothetical protein
MKLRKNGKPDLRYSESRKFDNFEREMFWKHIRAVIGWAIIFAIGANLLYWSIRNAPKTSPTPLGQKIEVKAVEIPCDADPLTYVRCRGGELRMPNQEIMKSIRIMKAESRCSTKRSKTCIPFNGVSGEGVDPYARNPNSSATGLYQFLWSTWDYYKCEGEKWDWKDSVNCMFKVWKEDGVGWDNHWNASRNKWEATQ